MRPVILIALVAAAGCAHGPTQRFTGNPYDITEHGGVISGDVCGLNVGYSIEHERGQTVLLGKGTIRLAVRDENGARHIDGILVGAPAAGDVNLYVGADRIVGHVNTLNVDLAAVGDSYRGEYRIAGDPHPGDMQIDGRQTILQMPRAELAALLPPMLKCNRRGGFGGPYRDPITREPVVIGFGGPAHYQTFANGRW